MQRRKNISVFIVVSLLIVGVALFSSQLGINPSWSKGRIALLICGLLVAAVPWVPKRGIERSEKIFQNDLFALPALLIVIAIYLWFASISRDSTSNYYALLATSFRQGEVSLSLRPDSALLALPNPYDPAAREGIKAPLDLSLYNGKFYLYWGPVPALLLALVQPFFPEMVSDGYLLVAFICGIFLSQFSLIMYIWARFFSEIPKWILILSILVVGLISPTLWLLTQPKIYETAIAGGQIFFLAGLLSVIMALDRPIPFTWGLGLAGTLWSFAVGTRSVLVFPIAFMTLIVVYWLFKAYHRSFPKFLIGFLPLGLSLIVGAIAFGWYNWARFGSIVETGFSYALAGPYLQEHLHELFSPAYIFQNLYNYLLNPFAVKQLFPFFYPIRGLVEEILSWQTLPEIYSAQAVTGLLYAAPFTLFAAIPAAKLFKKNLANRSGEESRATFFNWIIVSLIGSFLLSFISLLAFFWAAMRYAEDFMPTLTLLSIIGFWQGYLRLSQDPKKGKIFAIFGITLASISIIIGILLALSNYTTNGLL
jgi:hypothetical protein